MSIPKSNQRIRLVSTLPLHNDMADFLIDRQARGLSPRTVAWYAEKLAIVQEMLSAYGLAHVEDLRATTIRRLLLQLGETHNPGGVHGIYRALRAFLNWWESETEPQAWSNPMRKLHPPSPLPVMEQGQEGCPSSLSS